MSLTPKDLQLIGKEIKTEVEASRLEFKSDMKELKKEIMAELEARDDRLYNRIMTDVFTNFVTKQEFEEFKKEVREEFKSIKESIVVLQDLVIAIHQKLDHYMAFQTQKTDSNTSRIAIIENHLGL